MKIKISFTFFAFTLGLSLIGIIFLRKNFFMTKKISRTKAGHNTHRNGIFMPHTGNHDTNVTPMPSLWYLVAIFRIVSSFILFLSPTIFMFGYFSFFYYFYYIITYFTYFFNFLYFVVICDIIIAIRSKIWKIKKILN